MANKRIVLKPGYFITDKEIKRCHFSEITTADMWGENSEEYLVVLDGATSIVGKHKNDVHRTEKGATENHAERLIKHTKFCEKQIAYYKKQLTGE